MSYTPEQLLKLMTKYAESASRKVNLVADDDAVKTAAKKEKKKLDPKAKVRNRGNVCIPAESAKDKKDHFPINDEAQARNALARVHQYSSVPSWYSGSLKGLQNAVSRKVHSKYPGIGKDKKKSAELYVSDSLLAKYADDELEANDPEIQKELAEIKENANPPVAPAPFVPTPSGQAQAPVVKRPPAYSPPPDYVPETYAPPPNNPYGTDMEIDDIDDEVPPVKAFNKKRSFNKFSQIDFLLNRYAQEAAPRQALTFQRGQDGIEEIVEPIKQEPIEFPANPAPVKPVAPVAPKPAVPKPVPPPPPAPHGYAKENIDPWTGKRYDPNMPAPNVKHPTKSSSSRENIDPWTGKPVARDPDGRVSLTPSKQTSLDVFDKMIAKYAANSAPVAGYQVSDIQSALSLRPDLAARLSEKGWGGQGIDNDWGPRTEDAFSTWAANMNLPIGTPEQKNHAVQVLMSAMSGGQTPSQPGQVPAQPGTTPTQPGVTPAPSSPVAPAQPGTTPTPSSPVAPTPAQPGTTPTPVSPNGNTVPPAVKKPHHQHRQHPGQVPPPPSNAPEGSVPDYYPPNQPPPPPYGAPQNGPGQPQGQPQGYPPGQPDLMYEQGPGGVVPGYAGGVYPAGFGGRFQPGYGRGRPPGYVRGPGRPGGRRR